LKFSLKSSLRESFFRIFKLFAEKPPKGVENHVVNRQPVAAAPCHPVAGGGPLLHDQTGGQECHQGESGGESILNFEGVWLWKRDWRI
jgi:hypothetical protein